MLFEEWILSPELFFPVFFHSWGNIFQEIFSIWLHFGHFLCRKRGWKGFFLFWLIIVHTNIEFVWIQICVHIWILFIYFLSWWSWWFFFFFFSFFFCFFLFFFLLLFFFFFFLFLFLFFLFFFFLFFIISYFSLSWSINFILNWLFR